jgi:hypothetical protein
MALLVDGSRLAANGYAKRFGIYRKGLINSCHSHPPTCVYVCPFDSEKAVLHLANSFFSFLFGTTFRFENDPGGKKAVARIVLLLLSAALINSGSTLD